jgi:5-formyltetrahydrofolate cyclo-ligase
MSLSAIAQRSEAIVVRLFELEAMERARTVALFRAMEGKNEVELAALDRRLRERGVNVAYPSVDPDSREMVFRLSPDIESLEERGLGFREPPPDASEPTSIDVVVVPALAVDGRGHRLGYGAGFYDRTLVKYPPPCVAVVVAFDFQLVPEVPDLEGDVRVSWVVTDQRSFPTSDVDSTADGSDRKIGAKR